MKRMLIATAGRTIALLVLLAGFPVPSDAADDGGTRSIFAQGAGNRALAMGGAFTAVADDASAPLWNPGGLGIIERREFQASRASLYGLGMGEEYAALVLPSWRLGVAAITFRHFGVDGIEGRDERNVITDENLSNSETEIALSYGRLFGESLSLGGTLKLHRQSLAGLNATGLGADLGLLTYPGVLLGVEDHWAHRLTIGLSVRNLVEPTHRLEIEDVRDPMTYRIGTAYRQPFLRGGSILASIDIERSPDIDTRLHTGLEPVSYTHLTLPTN